MFTNRQPIRKTIAIVLMILLISVPIAGYAVNYFINFDSELAKMNDALRKTYHNYAGDIDIEEFMKGAIDGALKTLDDPYTNYFTPEEYKKFMGGVDMDLVGIGIFIEEKDGEIIVVRPIPNSPAAKAGMQANDRILRVGNDSTEAMTLDEVISRIRGQVGTTVNLLIKRGNQEIPMSLTRAAINIPNVYTTWHDGIAYFEIITFGENAASQFRNSFNSLKSKHSKIDGIIIDVRNNSGGRLQSVLEIADVLLQDKVIVSVVDKDNKRTAYASSSNTPAAGIPTVILVNELSASASEILAGALQDNMAATVVGTKTFGKGTVQSLVPVQGGGYVKVTSAQYFTPLSKVVDKVGITPDYYVEYPAAQLAKALDILKPSKTQSMGMKINDNQATFMGLPLTIDSKPFLQGSIPYVPYRFTIESFGGIVSWNDQTQTSETLWNGQRLYLDRHNLQHPIVKRDNRLYISILDLERYYGIKGSFNPLTHQIELRK